jgi:phage tail-like protein
MANPHQTVLQTVAWKRRERAVEHVNLSLVADFNRRYPGESVTLFARADVLSDLTQLRMSIDVPPGLDVQDFRVPDALLTPVPLAQIIGDGQRITWNAEQAIAKGARWEFEIMAVVGQDVGTGDTDLTLDCGAEAHACTLAGDTYEVSNGLALAVSPKGRYLKYLPGIYRGDELMGRFLMLFESFWGPIESQITQISRYLDPLMAPAPLLPWLASWADLALDERWPEAKQRRLIKSVVSLFRRRGTLQGLIELLEIYTGARPQIIEHRANNLVLGDSARLGPSIALGKGNVPHTFTVALDLPPLASERSAAALTDAEIARMKADRRRVIESIIDTEKPAHTRYTLEIHEAGEE